MHDKSVMTLLHRQLTDQLDGADRQLLIDWLAHSSQNVEEQQKVSQVWELSKGYTPTYEPDVDKSFQKFQKRLQADLPSQQPAKVIPLNPIKDWMKYAAIGVILIGALIVWQVSNSLNVDQLMVSTITNEVKSIDLVDGTKVWVNEKSTFTYPSKFINGNREVILEGEAFFDVEENKKKPFIIRTEAANVQVLGTSFSVNTANKDGLMEVEVKEGTVRVTPEGSSMSMDVTMNEKLYYDTSEKMFLAKEQLAVSNADFFVTNKYRFEDSKYTYVFGILERVYDVDFEFESEGLENCTFTSPIEFDKENINNTIKVIEAAYKNRNLTITKQGDAKYSINADPCN
ncbi:FecR family protein [Portibacter marinus]|uniref:FecR family protein n=1 Tax=Portibacter marinus TaxID=2898660 RepID=UPI001F19A3C7|nr:FecR family protein [Portibacter marinus]